MDKRTAIAAVIVVAIAAVIVIAAAAVATSDDGYAVTYDGNGGTTDDGDTTYVITSDTVESSRFERDGMVVAGWNTAADGSGTSYSLGDEITEDVTLYAQWAYALVLTSVSFMDDSDLAFFLLDTDQQFRELDLTTALPDNDNAGVVFIAPEGTVWEFTGSGNTFTYTGVNDTTVYTVEITMTGATMLYPAYVGNMGVLEFLFHGPLSCTISVSMSTA